MGPLKLFTKAINKDMKCLFRRIIKGIFLLVCCFCSTKGFSQTDRPFTQYSRMPYLYNPATAGIEQLTLINAGTRYQWVAADDAPKSYFVGINHAFQSEEMKTKIGVGGFILQESADVYRDLQVGVSAAVHVPVSEKFNFSLGFKVDYNSVAANLDKVRARDENDQFYRDLMASDGVLSYLNVSPGLMLHSANFYIGYSILGLVRSRLEREMGSEEKPGTRHIAMLGYVYQIDPDWEVIPSLLVQKEDNFDPVYNIMGKVRYQSKFWIGAGFSPDNAIVGIIGLSPINSFNLSYSYDHSIGEAKDYKLGSSHELMIGIPLGNDVSKLFW